jgi:ABC-type phosphate transport system auxiliary subunit
VSFNEDNIVNNIQNELIDLREDVIEINEQISKFNKKDLRLLNLDFERLLITSSEE